MCALFCGVHAIALWVCVPVCTEGHISFGFVLLDSFLFAKGEKENVATQGHRAVFLGTGSSCGGSALAL